MPTTTIPTDKKLCRPRYPAEHITAKLSVPGDVGLPTGSRG